MQIQVALSDDIAHSLEAKWGGLEQKLLELLLLTAYSEGSISVGKVRQLLGLSIRLEAEAWLAEKGVDLPYGENELQADRTTHEQMRNECLISS